MSDQGAEKLHNLSKVEKWGGYELFYCLSRGGWGKGFGFCGWGGKKGDGTYVSITTLRRASRHAGRTAL